MERAQRHQGQKVPRTQKGQSVSLKRASLGPSEDSRVLQRGRPSLAHRLPCPCFQCLPPGQSPPGPQRIYAFGTRYHNTDCREMKGQFANTHIRRPKGILPATSVRINGDGFYWGNVLCKQSPILGTLPKAWRAAQRPCPPALPSFRPCPLSPVTLGPVRAWRSLSPLLGAPRPCQGRTPLNLQVSLYFKLTFLGRLRGSVGEASDS